MTNFDQKKIVFLIHFNRSGSTYLSKLLDEYDELGVTIESSFPDGIVRKPLVCRSSAKVNKQISYLYNRKFKKWDIDPDDIEREIKSNNVFPLRFNEIFRIILNIYFKKNKSSSNIYIYKTGWQYLYYYKKVLNMFPDSKFLFLIRDGRAIFSSQKRSLISSKDKFMSDNPLRTAVFYKKIGEFLENENIKNRLHIVKYEDFIRKTDLELSSILDFLSVSNRNKTKENDYFRRIPSEQKHLHKNLNMRPITKRISAWAEELSGEEIFVFQKKAGKALLYFGYELKEFDFSGFYKFFIYTKYSIHFYYKRALDKIYALFNISYLKDRIWARLNKRNIEQ